MLVLFERLEARLNLCWGRREGCEEVMNKSQCVLSISSMRRDGAKGTWARGQ